MQWIDCRDQTEGSFRNRRSLTRYIVVHHAAALYPSPTGLEDVLSVHRYHLSRGWGGIGYHWACAEIVNGGEVAIYQCSDPDLIRAHVAWRNHESVGIAALTNFGAEIPDQKWIDALAHGIARLMDRYPNAVVVGHREIALSAQQSPDGKNWGTTCPGVAWDQWKPILMDRVRALQTVAPTRYTPDSPLLAPSDMAPDGVIAYLNGRWDRCYDPAGIATIITAYHKQATRLGLDWMLAVAQMVHETGYLTSFWSQRPQRNPAGIGVTGEFQTHAPADRVGWAYNTQRKRWEKGISFPSWADHAIPAHLGRLLAYALKEGEGSPDQQAAIANALRVRPLPAAFRGVAPTLAGLVGTWANPGWSFVNGKRVTYAEKIAEIANALMVAVTQS